MLTRRAALHGGLAAAGAMALPVARRAAAAAEPVPAGPLVAGPDDPAVWFTHSVASGDPAADGVVLWTRAYPLDGRTEVELTWVVARDPALDDVVRTGTVIASAATDWCAKVWADGLAPHQTYWYGFRAEGGTERSPTGRTRTAPAPGQAVDRLRFVLLTCNNPDEGRFNTLDRVAELDDSIDAVIHHGDYIYEYGRPGLPNAPWHTCVTLDDYRSRYASYRSFVQLRDAHRMHPWIHLWDDGDTANGAWRDGADGHDERMHGPWADRLAAAFRAFTEWTPCRLTGEVADTPVSRSLPYGDLAHLLVVDACVNRDRLWGNALQSFDAPELLDPARRSLSVESERWLASALTRSARSTWTVLTTQALVSHWGAPGLPDVLPPELMDHFLRRDGNQLYGTAWNGYPAQRQRLIDAVEAAGLRNLVVTSGDAHFSIAAELTRDPYNPLVYDPLWSHGSVGVELCCASVSSAGFAEGLGVEPRTVTPAVELASLLLNPHQRWLELDSKGYVLLELRPDRMIADYWFVPTVRQLDDRIHHAARLVTRAGTNHLDLDVRPGAAPPRRDVAPVPPEVATNPVAVDRRGGAAGTEQQGNRFPLPAGTSTAGAPAGAAAAAGPIPDSAAPAPTLPATGAGMPLIPAAAALAAALAVRRRAGRADPSG